MTQARTPQARGRNATGLLAATTSIGPVSVATLALGALSMGLVACEAPPPEPTPEKQPAAEVTSKAASAKSSRVRTKAERPKKKISAKPAAEVPVSEDDPIKGKFHLEDATAGLPKEGVLVATIKTTLGSVDCKLFEDRAPITVANFVGLARGLRPHKMDGEWVKKPAYDGTRFHRIIKGFMIQGGSQTGSDETGYVIPDEIWEDAHHDRPGLLCMANRGKNTNSKQFFITHGGPAHLDGGYTIFGECAPLSVVDELATVPTKGEKPVDPPKIESITISRKPADGGAAPSTSASAAPSASAASAAPSTSASAAAPKASASAAAPPK